MTIRFHCSSKRSRLNEESSEEESSSEEEPDSWRCEICRKDFKSDKQFENHERSKKHKEAVRKYQMKLRKETEKNAFRDIMDEIKEEHYLLLIEFVAAICNNL